MEIILVEDKEVIKEVLSGKILITLDRLQTKGLIDLNDDLLGVGVSFQSKGFKNKGDYLAIHERVDIQDDVYADGYVVSKYGSVYLIGSDIDENEYVYKIEF